MMDQCPYIYQCPFNRPVSTETESLVKEYLHTPGVLTSEQFSTAHIRKYCQGNYKECARFKIANRLGPENIPKNLLPQQLEKAERILAKHA